MASTDRVSFFRPFLKKYQNVP